MNQPNTPKQTNLIHHLQLRQSIRIRSVYSYQSASATSRSSFHSCPNNEGQTEQKAPSEPLPTPKPSKDVSEYMSTRRKKMAPSVMAKLVAKMPNESSDQIAAKLAERYG